jgi:hypothetical protein
MISFAASIAFKTSAELGTANDASPLFVPSDPGNGDA